MTTQPTVKAQSALDWLCLTLITFGALCLAASVPNTFTMVRVAHDDFGSAILVVVLEVMAFFALLAPLWVPAWTKTFDRIAYTLLGITTLGNYAGGWNYVWTHSEVGPFWLSIRDWREPIFGLPLATILLVGVLSGLVPFAMKFFISLAIKRYRENELDRSPEAVAQRAIEPVLVQIIATKRLQEQLVGLTESFREPLLLTGQAQLGVTREDVAALVRDVLGARQEGEQRRPFEVPAEMVPMGAAPDLDVALQAVQKAHTCDGLPLTDFCADCYARWEDAESGRGPAVGAPVPSQAVTEASDADENAVERELTRAEVKRKVAEQGWESLTWGEMGKMPASPEKEAERQRRIAGLKATGLRFLRESGLLVDKPANVAETPVEVPAELEAPQEAGQLAEASTAVLDEPVVRVPAPEPVSASGSAGAVATWTCSGCDKEGSNGAKGKATSWSRDRGLEPALYCADCRKSGKYGK